MNKNLPELDWNRVDALIRMALDEDLGDLGDTTTNSVIDDTLLVNAVFLCKEDCVCAGLNVAERLMKTVDSAIEWENLVKEGDFCKNGTHLARVRGKARSLLTGERTALNFLQRLSGVATASRRYQTAVAGSGCVVLDTRKTTPGWRNLEKYAVAVGGASNHRIGLYDRVMIKDNHRELAGLGGTGGILRSVERARKMYPNLEVEVEIDALSELPEALESKAEYILLDNMSNEEMAEAVRMTAHRTKLEASGNMNLARLPSVAATGVDFISVGALTHSVKSADISMDIQMPGDAK